MAERTQADEALALAPGRRSAAEGQIPSGEPSAPPRAGDSLGDPPDVLGPPWPSVRADDPDTSRASWAEGLPRLQANLRRLLDLFAKEARFGLTCDDICRRWRARARSISSRISRLERSGHLVEAKRRALDLSDEDRQPTRTRKNEETGRHQRVMVHWEHASMAELQANLRKRQHEAAWSRLFSAIRASGLSVEDVRRRVFERH